MIFKSKNEQDSEKKILEAELERAKGQLMEAYNLLDNYSDSEMIEVCIYEIIAKEKRYSYILRKLKEASGQ